MVLSFSRLQPHLRRSVLRKVEAPSVSRLIQASGSMADEFEGIIVTANFELKMEGERNGGFISVTRVMGNLEREIFHLYLDVVDLSILLCSMAKFRFLKLELKGNTDTLLECLRASPIQAETLILGGTQHAVDFFRIAKVQNVKLNLPHTWFLCEEFLVANQAVMSPKKSLTLKVHCGHHVPKIIQLLPNGLEVVFDCSEERNWNFDAILDAFLDVAERARDHSEVRLPMDVRITGTTHLENSEIIETIKDRLTSRFKFTRCDCANSSLAVLVPGARERKHVLFFFDRLSLGVVLWKARITVIPLESFAHFYTLFCAFATRHVNDPIGPNLAKFLHTVQTELF